MPDLRQTRRQDTINGILVIILGTTLGVTATVSGYLLVTERNRIAQTQQQIIDKIDSLESSVTALEVYSQICECSRR